VKGRQLKRVWGHPWSYDYLLAIEQRKLQEMARYFKKSKLTTDWERQSSECALCVKLLQIVREQDQPMKSWLKANYNPETILETKDRTFKPFKVYVNTTNYKRFMPKGKLNAPNEILQDFWKIELRKMKAFHLYHKIRLEHMMSWWD
jgi:hypothetical protein